MGTRGDNVGPGRVMLPLLQDPWGALKASLEEETKSSGLGMAGLPAAPVKHHGAVCAWVLFEKRRRVEIQAGPLRLALERNPRHWFGFLTGLTSAPGLLNSPTLTPSLLFKIKGGKLTPIVRGPARHLALLP